MPSRTGRLERSEEHVARAYPEALAELITMGEIGDHDAGISDHDPEIPDHDAPKHVITMPKSVITMVRNPQRDNPLQQQRAAADS